MYLRKQRNAKSEEALAFSHTSEFCPSPEVVKMLLGGIRQISWLLRWVGQSLQVAPLTLGGEVSLSLPSVPTEAHQGLSALARASAGLSCVGASV